MFKQEQQGAEAASLLPDIIQQALNELPIPKRMRWGDLPGEFVRPVHWLVLLLGDEVVPMELLGVTADRFSRGHRFHNPQPIQYQLADDLCPTTGNRRPGAGGL